MIIKRLAASFGNLQNKELILREGLNIVEGPNEAGKSTWCAFIKAMLYGVDTSERDRTGFLSDKTRYRPWSGAPMEGAMDVFVEGRDISLQRLPQGAAPMKNFSANYSDTAESVPSLTGASAGESLTGVPLRVFERSAFIRQSGLPVSQTAELEKRISALVSTGEEASSYTEADDRLRSWLRKRRHNKSGLLPKLESDLARSESKLLQMERQNSELGGTALEIERLEKQRDKLKEDIKAHDKIAAAEKSRKVSESKAAVLSAEAECRRIKGLFPVDGEIPSNEELKSARDEAYAVQSMAVEYGRAENEKAAAESERDALSAKKNASIWSGLSPDEAEKQANDTKAEYCRSQEALKFGPVATAISVIAIVLGVACLIWFRNIGAVIPTVIPLAACLLLCACPLIYGRIRVKRANAHMAELLAEQKVSNIDELLTRLSEYAGLCAELEAAEVRLSQLEAALSSAKSELERREEALIQKIHLFCPGFIGISDALNKISKMEKLLYSYERANLNRNTANEIYNALSATLDAGNETAAEIPPMPEMSRDEASFALRRAEGRLEELSKSYNMSQGKIRALGDPVVIGAEKNTLEHELERRNKEYEAIQLAIEALSEANTEIQTRFSPRLSRRAGELMTKLTGGKYQKLVFDKDLNTEAQCAGDTVGRSLLTLSEGTAGGAYLALRLTISELVFPLPCPLILDDALVNFDEERVKYALDLIYEISKERQVILFTCHSREREYFKDNTDVNIVTL